MPRLAIRQRSLALLAMAACLLPLLTGCADEKKAPGTITLVVWGLQFGEETKGLEARIKEFERRNPHIKVSALSMGAGNMNPQKLMTAVVGNVPPDVINQDRFTIGDWASRDTFMQLDKFVAEDRNKKNDPLAIREEEYYPACWQEAVYNGHIYAIPNSTDDRALYYNRALFREAGLDPDRPPRTWEELEEVSKKLTKFSPDGSFKRVGFMPNYGNSWLYLYSWQNGGEFMTPDGKRCTLANPYSIDALKYMVRLYDAVGGVTKADNFASGFQNNELDPFFTGKVAMKVDGNWTLANIARYKPSLDFAVAPAPVPAARLEQTEGGQPGRFHGQKPYVTWSGGFSYAIPAGAAHPKEAWEFIRWMCSTEATLIDAQASLEYNRSKGRPFVPNLAANRRVNQALMAQYAPPSERFRKPLEVFIALMESARYRPVTFVGQYLWDEHVRAFDQATHWRDNPRWAANKDIAPKEAMEAGQRKVQAELDKNFSRDKFPLLNENVPIAIGVGLGAILLAALLLTLWRVHRMGELSRREAYAGFIFASPWIIGFLLLTAGPIVASFFLSFCDYDVLHAPRWLGMHNYTELMGSDRDFLIKSLYNAGYLAVFGIPLGIVTGLAIAMLLNAKVKGMSVYRTFFYLPSIVPVVASVVLWQWVLNGDPDRGLLNALWKVTLTAWFNLDPPGWFSSADWAKPGLIVQGLWGAGGGMILWLAGLQGVPQHLYEAADLDGANWWQRFRNVTLPMLSPYIFFNLIMGTIGALQEFDRAYMVSGQAAGGSSAGPMDSLLVPVLYLFNNAFKYFKMGYASALAWVLFVIILGLTVIQLKMAPRWVHYEAEKK